MLQVLEKKYRNKLLCISTVFLAACSSPAKNDIPPEDSFGSTKTTMSELEYPEARKGDVVDTYFGTNVSDPYRWLEDDQSSETGDWVTAQNELTFSYLESIPYREKLKDRLTTLWNYEKVSAPFEEGGYTYFYKNDGLQNHWVIYRHKENSEPEVFLDPNTFSDDGTVSMSGLSFSKDGSLAAYALSEGGSDWKTIVIIDAETKEVLEDPITNVKFSGISWKGNEGFFYSAYDQPDGSVLSAKTDQHKLYFHKLGASQQNDRLYFGGTEQEKRRYVYGSVTEDDRYLVISAKNTTAGNELYIKDLSKEDSALVTILDDQDSNTYVLDNQGEDLLLVTNRDAPNKKVVKVSVNNPTPGQWQDVIPETEHVLSVSTGGGYIFADYMVDAITRLYQYNYQGEKIREIELPGRGSAGGLSGKIDQDTLYYSFTNYKTPGTLFSFDVATGTSEVYRKSKAIFDSDRYVTQQVFYPSKDGTRIPMIITHKKGLVLNGENPTLLYGYGGFNISLTPRFSIIRALWMELGGVYAVANLRGGGEYGKNWHKAGTQLQKQNVFDDFTAAAQYLFQEGYTSSDYLAIQGGSNGGLLVGAVMTQQPELAKVALPAVGVMDMLRYHKFTAGAGWSYDYGTSDQDEEMFEYLYGYSPVHNIEEGVSYPATLVTTGNHDDRVVPAHSYKFAAELQAKQSGENPALIRIETRGGHGAGTPVSQAIEEWVDIYSFTLYNMGVESLDQPGESASL